jgi:O-antigen chain-terminating methyltransferase
MTENLFEIHDDEIDVDEIVRRIQERVRQRPQEAPRAQATAARVGHSAGSALPPAARASADLVQHLETLRANWDPEAAVPETSRLMGLKRLVFWMIRPFARAQTAFNAAAMWAFSTQVERANALVQGFDALEARLGDLHTDLVGRQEEIGRRLAGPEHRVGEMAAVAEGRATSLEQLVAGVSERVGPLERRVEDLRAAQEGIAATLEGRTGALESSARNLEQRLEEMRQLAEAQRAMQEQIRQAEERLQNVETVLARSAEAQTLAALEQREVDLGRRHELLRQEVLLQKRRLELILREVRQKAGVDQETGARLQEEEKRLSDHLFFLHDRLFRGTDEELRQRMQIYLPVFAERRAQVGEDACVLDIGCGRGTLLGLLKEAGVPARGVEVSEEMVSLCQEQGLDVVQGDGLRHLASLPDGSLLGVAALHVVEHLPAAALIEFVKLCHQKIHRGGALVLETPNPSNLLTGASEFHMDITHLRPIHPLALAHLVESLGFVDVETRYLHPPAPEERLRLTSGAGLDLQIENSNWEQLNGVLYGPRDYAVIATR